MVKSISHPTAREKNYYTYSTTGIKLQTEQRYDPNLIVVPLLTTGPTNDGLIGYKLTELQVTSSMKLRQEY